MVGTCWHMRELYDARKMKEVLKKMLSLVVCVITHETLVELAYTYDRLHYGLTDGHRNQLRTVHWTASP